MSFLDWIDWFYKSLCGGILYESLLIISTAYQMSVITNYATRNTSQSLSQLPVDNVPTYGLFRLRSDKLPTILVLYDRYKPVIPLQNSGFSVLKWLNSTLNDFRSEFRLTIHIQYILQEQRIFQERYSVTPALYPCHSCFGVSVKLWNGLKFTVLFTHRINGKK